MPKEVSLDRVGRLIETNIGCFLEHFNTLIDIFSDQLNRKDMDELNKNWMLARKLAPDDEIVNMISHYFLIFEKKILAEGEEFRKSVKEMLEYDYTKHIVRGCNENTKKLIINITDGIKSTYLKGDAELNTKIENTVRNITKHAVRNKKLNALIGIAE